MFPALEQKFNTLYDIVYPGSLHLKHQLWYREIKFTMIKALLQFITYSGKNTYKLCDVGGGYGYDDTLIRKIVAIYFPHVTIEVDLFDPDIDFYRDTIHNKQPDITYFIESFLSIDTEVFNQKYDIIICSEVYEHLRGHEQEICITNFNKILQVGGIVILTTPNGSSLMKNIYGLIQWKKQKYDTFFGEHNHRYAHIGIPTLFQMIGIFIRKGFSLTKIVPSTITSGIPLSKISIVCNKIFLFLAGINLFFSTDNVYIAIKKDTIDSTKRYNSLPH